jgi:pyroglutamyl-peptidase
MNVIFSFAFLIVIGLTAGCATNHSPSLSSSTRKLVLLTTFEPFGKWKVNLSNDIADQVTRIQAQNGELIDFKICRLPVEYDRAAERAIRCLSEVPKNPDLVISLGEGHCGIHMETAVTNIDHTPQLADNSGIIRKDSPIFPGADRRLGLTLPIEKMFCSIPESYKNRVYVSVSAGNYVCNNTGYRLAKHFRDRQVPYGIIHVPHSGCSADIRDIGKNAEVISHFIVVALRSNSPMASPEMASRVPSQTQSILPMPLPSTEEEVRNLVKVRATASEPSRSSCQRDLIDQLLLEYEKNKKNSKIRM